MGEFKKMTPEERKVQKEEVMTAMTELKNSEEWQGADKKDQMKMLKESGHFPLRGFGKAMGKKIEFSEEAMTVMTELKSSEEWQNADKDEQREMLGEIMEEFGIERNLKAMHPFVKGLKKGFHKGMKWNK